LFTFETARSEMPDNISCFGFDDGCISEGERGPATEEEEIYLE